MSQFTQTLLLLTEEVSWRKHPNSVYLLSAACAIAATVFISTVAVALAVYLIFQKHVQRQHTFIMDEAITTEGDASAV